MTGSPVKLLVAVSLIAGAALASADAAIKMGSAAPAIKVAKWIKGTPVTKFEPGKVYVVEFWATWCGPCKTSIPHLTELAKKYKGKATFTGVSAFEVPNPKDESYIANVEKFVTDWGPKMDYNVAVDGKEGWMGSNWMKAAEQPGIPTAFVVDQKGTIVWIGHPMMGLDEVVGQVVAGKYDMAAEIAKQAKAKAEQNKMMAEVNAFLVPMRSKDFAKALVEMDKAFKNNPALEVNYAMVRFTALSQTDVPAAMAYADAIAKGIYKNNPMALNSIAWAIVDDKSTIKGPDFAVAVRVAEAGVAALKPGMDQEGAYILDTLAYAYFKNGQLDQALATQEKALAAANKAKDFDAATKKEIEDRLAMYKSKKG